MALKNYNADMHKGAHLKKATKYRKGSLAQKLFEPLATAVKDENGTYNMDIEECEITKVDEETLRRKWEHAKKTNEIFEGETEDDDFRNQLMEDLQADNVSLEKWNKIIAEELGVFKEDEKYDYVTDLKRNFEDKLAESK